MSLKNIHTYVHDRPLVCRTMALMRSRSIWWKEVLEE